jgi:hypothetical protein
MGRGTNSSAVATEAAPEAAPGLVELSSDLIWLNAADGRSLKGKAKPRKRTQQNLREAHMSDLRQRASYTVMFLRMAEKQTRELAERTPEIARELHHIADALNGEANDLTKHISE